MLGEPWFFEAFGDIFRVADFLRTVGHLGRLG